MRKRRLILTTFAGIVGLIVAWFLIVDWSWFIETCPDCNSQWSRTYYRVFGVPITERTDSNTMMLELVSEDLGVPCAHSNLIRRHKHRRWGLCICAFPCRNGIDGLAGDSADYNQAMSARVQALAKENPKLGPEFHQRVLVEHDYVYWHEFLDQVKTP